jgi:hypothetical protein
MSAPADLLWGRQKRLMTWIHHGIQIAVLLALFVMLNLLTQKFPARWDMTSRRTYAISMMAEDLLKNLKYDVDIWINSETIGAGEDKSLPNGIIMTVEMLREFQRRTNHVRIYHLFEGPSTPKLDVYQKHWSVVTPASLFILATMEGGRENKKQIDIQELYQGNATTGEVTLYKGEPIVVQTIRDLGGSIKRIAYESEGHHETVTADVRKLGTIANFLRLNEGIEFRRLPLAEYKTIPVDCDLLVIMAPEQPFLEHELEVIKEYMERGGSVLVTIRPKVRTGLEKLLEEYNVKVGDNIVMDPQQYNPPSRANLVVVDFNLHPVNRAMANVQFLMPQCCTIDPMPRRDTNWTITPLAMAGPNSWEEKGEVGPSSKQDADERGGNMKLIVAVEKTASHPMDEKHKMAKLVVWGTSLPFTNDLLRSGFAFQSVQGQYVVNHFRWLMDRQLLEIEPKKMSLKPLQMSAEALDRLGYTINWGFPIFAISLGVLAWFLRRK